ncbi:MAG: hypothetical protein ACPL1D_00520 [Microgenomates group bacterium]
MRLLLMANLLSIFIFSLRFNRLPPQIPLLYSRQEGEEQLVDWWLIFLIPLIMVFFFFLNEYLKKKFFNNDSFITRLITDINIIMIILLTGIFIKIIFLIT